MVFGKKKKQDEVLLPATTESNLPEMPIPARFKEKYGGTDNEKESETPIAQKRVLPVRKNSWKVIEEQIPASSIYRLINEQTGEEFEISNLQDVADLLNGLEE